jgi:hypothetical protein
VSVFKNPKESPRSQEIPTELPTGKYQHKWGLRN